MELPADRKFDFVNGEILLIDKPPGWTSFAVVRHLRNFICQVSGVKKIRVGHAGTLDPMATGLLIVCTGKATKRISEFAALDKTYNGTLMLGASTPTYDGDSEPDHHYPIGHITPALLEKARQSFIGTIDQIPPVYSALKVAGKPAYSYARKNIKVALTPRQVTIKRFEFINIDMPTVDFIVECSKGTYIRSLVHDFGHRLSCGAYLASLTRTSIGNYRLQDAHGIDEFKQAVLAQL